jgi:hypothetical protein
LLPSTLSLGRDPPKSASLFCISDVTEVFSVTSLGILFFWVFISFESAGSWLLFFVESVMLSKKKSRWRLLIISMVNRKYIKSKKKYLYFYFFSYFYFYFYDFRRPLTLSNNLCCQ